MSLTLTLTPVTPRRVKNAVSPGIFSTKGISRLLRLAFVSGPWLLMTTRLTTKHAFLMILLCVPALLFSSMLILPAIIFQSPQQQAYFYFSQMLNQDPTRWIILGLTGFCSVTALAIPAMIPKPFTAIRY
ncbi:MAG: hypothetical protein V4819_13355 [Verrucomicrobiota bacterium]